MQLSPALGKVCTKHPELNGARRNGDCIACKKARSTAWQKENPARHKEFADSWKSRNPTKIKGYGLAALGFTPASFEAAIKAQDGRCAICRVDLSTLTGRQVHADHDHVTGKARGVLCQKCNQAIGLLGEDPDRVVAAANYLNNPTLKD